MYGTGTHLGTGTYAVTKQSFNSFSSPVSLTVQGLPGNQVLPGTGFSPQTVTPPANGSVGSTLTIVTNNATPTGQFTMFVVGDSGALTRNFQVTFTINSTGSTPI